MDKFERILKKIKEVEIQGAEAVAKAGVEAYLLKPDSRQTIKRLTEVRPTEPLLQNILNTLSWQSKKNLHRKAKQILKYIEEGHKKIAKAGSELIRNGMNVFTHCHSSSVVNILKQSKKQGKKFQVFVTETRPLLQGRITARELAKARIKTFYLADLAAPLFLEKADMLLVGVDAYTKKGLVNKIGTATLAKLAYMKKIPIYSAGISLKYANKIRIEQRKPSEVWLEREKNIIPLNPAFDLTDKEHITGVISELGILPYNEFIKQAKKVVAGL